MNLIKAKSLISMVIVFLGILSVLYPFETKALSVSPVRLEIKGDPGQVLNTEMTLTNDTENSQIFYSSFANFQAQGETGNPSFVESKDDLDKWISTEESVALPAGGSLIVPITIKIPTDADAGGHFAAVFWGTSPNTTGAQTISIGAKIGMLILLSVSGDVVEAGGLLEFSTIDDKFWYNTLPVSFRYRFSNDGGDRIKPMGKVKIRNTVFIPVDKIDPNISQGNILPGSIRRFEFDWIKSPRAKDFVANDSKVIQFFDTALYQFKNFAVGLYSAKLNLSYGLENLNTTKTVYFFVFPWQMLICLIIIIIIVLWGGSKLLKRYNRHIIQRARLGMSLPSDANHG